MQELLFMLIAVRDSAHPSSWRSRKKEQGQSPAPKLCRPCIFPE